VAPTLTEQDTARIERVKRLRLGVGTDEDVTWLIAVRDPQTPADILCDCRCQCHLGAPCNRRMDMDTLDCSVSCRAAHILASECDLNGTRADV
jgi:hypothetical protein